MSYLLLAVNTCYYSLDAEEESVAFITGLGEALER